MMDDMRSKIAAILMRSYAVNKARDPNSVIRENEGMQLLDPNSVIRENEVMSTDPGYGAPGTSTFPKGLTLPPFDPSTGPFAGSAMGNMLAGQSMGLSPEILEKTKPLLDRFRALQPVGQPRPAPGAGMVRGGTPMMGGGMGFMGNSRRPKWEIGIGGPQGRAPIRF